MKGNEKGFTYPLVLCLLIVFLAFFSMNVELMLAQRKQAHETLIMMQEELYFLSSVKKVEKSFQSDGKAPAKGTFHFQNGRVDFLADALTGDIQKIQFTLRLNSGEMIIGKGFFDTKQKN